MAEEVVVSGEPVKKDEEKKVYDPHKPKAAVDPDEEELPPYHTRETFALMKDRAKERTGTIKATVTDVDPARTPPPVVPGEVVRHVPKTVHDVAAVPFYQTKDVEYENNAAPLTTEQAPSLSTEEPVVHES